MFYWNIIFVALPILGVVIAVGKLRRHTGSHNGMPQVTLRFAFGNDKSA